MQEPFAPIFVVGCERSGTTLLAAMLDRHSQVAVPPETLFFSDVVHHGFWRRGSWSHASLLRAALGGRVGEFGLDQAELLRDFQSGPCSMADLFRCILQAHARRKGKPRAGEKSILHVLYVPLLMRWYPQAKFLGIVRDGRDVVRSMMSSPWKPNKLRAKSCNWRLKMRLLLRWQKAYPGRFMTVRYEELLLETSKTLGAVDAFLGLDPEAGQLDPSQGTGVYLERERSYKAKVLEAVDSSRAFVWKKALSKGDLAAMDSIMGPTLRRLGYEATPPAPGASSGAQAAFNAIMAALWIAAFQVAVGLNGLIAYDKIRYLWLRRKRSMQAFPSEGEPQP
jgi:hypothetical protein